MDEAPKKTFNFIESFVEQDLKEGKNDGRIQTRFPPSPRTVAPLHVTVTAIT